MERQYCIFRSKNLISLLEEGLREVIFQYAGINKVIVDEIWLLEAMR
jgi:hypothetical protein